MTDGVVLLEGYRQRGLHRRGYARGPALGAGAERLVDRGACFRGPAARRSVAPVGQRTTDQKPDAELDLAGDVNHLEQLPASQGLGHRTLAVYM